MYRERLRVPVAWWVTGLFFAVSFVTAVGFYVGPEVALAAAVLASVGVAGALLWFGGMEVAVDAAGLRAGEAVLEWTYLGRVEVLDRASARRRLGPDADHAAWLAIRGYVPGAVEVAVEDPDDPHPYWLVSSRNPEKLAAAIEESRPISP